MANKNVKKFIIAGVIALLVIVTVINSCTVISPNERGVKVTLGQVEGDVLQPGMQFHAPFITKIRCFRLEPKTYEVSFSCGNDGAITKDMQTVGSTVAVRYVYDERRIMDIVTRYLNDSVIQSAMRDNVKASLKETVGQYSIYDLVEKQNEVTGRVAEAMLTRMADYPIDISQTTITNWDWSDDFDKQIKETANRAQEVKKAEQDLKLAEQQAQKQVKEAEAKKVEADALAYYNAKVAQNYQVEIKLKELEIELERAKKWDGRQVPEYVPLTAAGGIINLPEAKK